MNRSSKLAGYSAIAISVLLTVAIYTSPEKLNAPSWVGYLAGLSFAFAGISILARVYKRPSLANAFALVILGSMALIGGYIGFGPGTRSCSGTITGVGLQLSGADCRTGFAIGSIIVAAMFVYGLVRFLRFERGH
jgi:hypothetical protein